MSAKPARKSEPTAVPPVVQATETSTKAATPSCGTPESRARHGNKAAKAVNKRTEPTIYAPQPTILTPVEKDAVTKIIALCAQEHDCRLQIGEVVAQTMQERGDNIYGDKTLERLAKHSLCSEEHLRRCLHVYRLEKEHGEELRDTALSFHHRFELSRLMSIENGNKRREAIRQLATTAASTGLRSEQLGELVSERLGLASKPKRKKRAKPAVVVQESLTAVEQFTTAAETIGRAVDQLTRRQDRQELVDCNRLTCTLGTTYVRMLAATLKSGAGNIETIASAARQVADEINSALQSLGAQTKGGGR